MIGKSSVLDPFIDRAYEAAAGLFGWNTLLQDLARIADAAVAVLVSPSRIHTTTVPQDADVKHWLEKTGNMPLDHWEMLLRILEQKAVVDGKDLPPLHPWNAGSCHLNALRINEFSVVALLRPPSAHPFEPEVRQNLIEVQPHIERAVRIASSLSANRVKPVIDALTALGLPTVILDCEGHPIVGNDLLHPLVPSIIRFDDNRLAVSDSKADQLLGRVFKEATKDPANVRSIALSTRHGHMPSVLHLVPLSQEENPLDKPARWVVVVTNAGRLPVPRRSVLAAIFNLTPAEARVAHLLAKSQTADEISQNLEIGRETARTHIKSVLEKAGVRRHVDFVRVVSGLHSLPLLGKRTHL